MSFVSDFLHDAKLFALLCKSFNKFFHALVLSRTHSIVGSHCYPFANFDQIAGFIPKAERSTPGSFGATPSRAFEPCGDAVRPAFLSFKGCVPSNRSTPL